MITILAGVLLLVVLVSIIRIFRWATEKVPMHTHSWDDWMDDNCLCQRCSHIRALETDLFESTVKSWKNRSYMKPTYVLTVNEERGILYSERMY